MATYIITGPDGKEFEVDAPDGATEEEVLAFAEANYTAAAPAPAKAEPPSPKEKYAKVAEGQSFLENLGAGFGGAMTGFGLGARQLIPGMKDPSPEEIADWKASMEGLRGTVGGFLGEAGGYMAVAAPAMIAGGASVPIAAASSGVLGALTPAESTGERVKNIAISGITGAAGQGLGNMLGSKASQGMLKSNLTGEQARVLQAAQEAGMEFTPGQMTGSRRLLGAERAMAQNPMTSKPFDALAEKNQLVANRAFARAIGEEADDVGTQTLSNAHTRISAVFDAARDDTPVFLGKPIANKLNKINKEFSHLLAEDADVRLPNKLVEMIGKQGATREELGSLSTQLRQKAESLISSPQGDRNLARALFEVREVVEDTIQKSLAPSEAKLYKQARAQYRNLMTGIASGAVNESSGNINAQALGRALTRKNRGDFVFGNRDNDLLRVAHAARAVRPLEGGSDTMAKQSIGSYLHSIGPALGFGAIGGVAGGSTAGPLGALLGAAAAERIIPATYLGAGRWMATPHPQLGRAIASGSRAVAPVGGLTAIKATSD